MSETTTVHTLTIADIHFQLDMGVTTHSHAQSLLHQYQSISHTLDTVTQDTSGVNQLLEAGFLLGLLSSVDEGTTRITCLQTSILVHNGLQ